MKEGGAEAIPFISMMVWVAERIRPVQSRAFTRDGEVFQRFVQHVHDIRMKLGGLDGVWALDVVVVEMMFEGGEARYCCMSNGDVSKLGPRRVQPREGQAPNARFTRLQTTPPPPSSSTQQYRGYGVHISATEGKYV